MNTAKRIEYGEKLMSLEELAKEYLSLTSVNCGGREQCFEQFDSLNEVCKQHIINFVENKDLFMCRLASKSLKRISDRVLRENKKRLTINRYWTYEKIASVINLYNRATTLYIVSVFCDLDTCPAANGNDCGSSLALETDANIRGESSKMCQHRSLSEVPVSFDEIGKLCVGKDDIYPVTTANSPTHHRSESLPLSEYVTELVIDHDYKATNSNFYVNTMRIVDAVRDSFKNLKQIALCGPYNDIDIRRIFMLFRETLRAFHLICAGRDNRSEATEIIAQCAQGGVIAKTEVDFHGEIAFRHLGACRRLRGLTLDNLVNAMRCFDAIPDDAAARLVNLRLVCAEEAIADEGNSRIKSFLDVTAIAKKCSNLRELTVGGLKYINFAVGILQLSCLNRLELVLRFDPRDNFRSPGVDANENFYSSDESDSDEENESDDDDDAAISCSTESESCSDSSTTDRFGDSSNSADDDLVDGNEDEITNGDEPILNDDGDDREIGCEEEICAHEEKGEVGAQLANQVINQHADVIPNEAIHDVDDIVMEEENDNADDVEMDFDEQFLYGDTIFVDNYDGEVDDILTAGTAKIENIYFTAQNGKSSLLRRLLEKVLLEYMFSIPTRNNLTPKDAGIRNFFSKRLAENVQKVRIKYDLCGEKPIVTKRLLRRLALKLREQERSRSMPILQLDACVGYDNVGGMTDWYDKFATLLDYAAIYFTRGVVCNLHVARDAYSRGVVRKSEVDYILLNVEGTNKRNSATEANERVDCGVIRKIFGHIKFDVFFREFNF